MTSPARLPVRLAAVLLAAAVLLFGVLALPIEAAADPVSSCTPSRGVIVAVDFGHWGGAVQRGCDANPTTGYQALHAAGFSTDGTRHDGPAFVCRIDGYPASDPCIYTSPSRAYWSYWHANPGQNGWSYSSQGSMSYHPVPGSVDAWAFGAGSRPSFTPAAVRAAAPPASSPAPSRTAPAGGGSTPSVAGSAVDAASSRIADSRAAGSAGTAGKAPAARSSSPVASTPGSASPAATPTPSGSGPRIIDAVPVAQHPATAGRSPLPVVLTLAAVLLLGGTAGWTAWQRRRRAG